jgi:triosephosphate isomerase
MTARTPLMAGNWKMHKTGAEGAEFVRTLHARIGDPGTVEVVVAPPFTGLAEAVAATAGASITVAAQNCHWEEKGAFTGEVSPPMLVSLGVHWVIIGHSERRQLFGETDEGVARKVRAVLEHGLLPIMCVGETEAERVDGRTEDVLRRQVAGGLAEVRPDEATRLVVAYEPVWAIGTGRTATPEMAQEACAFVRQRVAAALGGPEAEAVRVLYGGSVKPDNVDELMAQADIDGALVGGASLDVESFARIVEFGREPRP